jgi:hypothetical protein
LGVGHDDAPGDLGRRFVVGRDRASSRVDAINDGAEHGGNLRAPGRRAIDQRDDLF